MAGGGTARGKKTAAMGHSGIYLVYMLYMRQNERVSISVDAGTNDLGTPGLYKAPDRIVPCRPAEDLKKTVGEDA